MPGTADDVSEASDSRARAALLSLGGLPNPPLSSERSPRALLASWARPSTKRNGAVGKSKVPQRVTTDRLLHRRGCRRIAAWVLASAVCSPALAACAALGGQESEGKVKVTTRVVPPGQRPPAWLRHAARTMVRIFAVADSNVTVFYRLGPAPLIALTSKRLACPAGVGKWQCPVASGSGSAVGTTVSARFDRRSHERLDWSFGTRD